MSDAARRVGYTRRGEVDAVAVYQDFLDNIRGFCGVGALRALDLSAFFGLWVLT
jgi:hypothetical protein